MIELNLKNGNKQADLYLEETDYDMQKATIKNVFAFMNDNKHSGTPDKKTKRRDAVPGNHETAAQHSANNTNPKQDDQEKPDQVKERSRQLPFVNSSNNSTFSMAELMNKQGKSYDCKCSYTCPECGYEGVRYLPFGFRFTFCEECNTKLFLRAASDEWGEEDENGNVYLANEVYQD